MRHKNLYVGAAFLALLGALWIVQLNLQKVVSAEAKTAVQAPRFEVDPMWPKPLPNHWLLGMADRCVGRFPRSHLDHSSQLCDAQ